MMNLSAALGVASALFLMGLYGALTRRNVLRILICIELMLNAANLAFAAASSALGTLTGHMMALFVIVVAAAEVTVGLAILIVLMKVYGHVESDRLTTLKW